MTTVEGTGAARRPNPEFLLHSTTASRFAAPIEAPPPPAFIAAAEAAHEKHDAVLKAAKKAVKARGGGPSGDELIVPAGATYNELIDLLGAAMKAKKLGETSPLGALDLMARRTAGRIVRNAASLGGNTMLVLKHIASGTGEPFPSDLFTALVAVDAKIAFLVLEPDGTFVPHTATAGELVTAVVQDPGFADRIVLTSYALPCGARDVVLAQKVALREVNAHSIVNATTRFQLAGQLIVEQATLVYGGIAPFPWRPGETEAAMTFKPLTLDGFGALARLLEQEVRAELARWAERMAEAPDEGFTAEYRIQLAVSFLYKAIVNALIAEGAPVPPPVRSSGEITWGNWPVSDGMQHYVTQSFKKPVGQPYIKSTAMYQTAGQLHYTQELPVPPLTVNGALVQSRRALASYRFVIPGQDEPVDAAFALGMLPEDLREKNLYDVGDVTPFGQALSYLVLLEQSAAVAVSLISTFNAKMHGGEVQVPAMTFKPMELQPDLPGVKIDETAKLGGGVDSFVGFTYSAALSVVEVDVLTGEVKILSSDIVYDMGWSMNPALDIGQVEGAFVQGIGYLTSEKLVLEPAGEEKGRLNTTNTWRYKIPAVTSIPLELNTYLFPRDLPSVAGIPEDPNEVFSAKEVGEPPLVLANTVFFAIKAAIRASRLERGLDGLFRFDAPATVQEVRRACELSSADFTTGA